MDGLHDIATALDDRRFAIVGGIAVLTHVQGHRVTQDINSAVRGRAQEIHDALLVVAEPDDGDADVLLPNGVPVDLLVAGPDSPRSSIGRGGQAKRREATGHALRWAIDTAISRELVCAPENPRGPVAVPVASVSALLAMKAIALTDPARGEKAVTDRLDLWLLLNDDVHRAAAALQELWIRRPPRDDGSPRRSSASCGTTPRTLSARPRPGIGRLDRSMTWRTCGSSWWRRIWSCCRGSEGTFADD